MGATIPFLVHGLRYYEKESMIEVGQQNSEL